MQADIGARMSRCGTNRWRYLCATEGDGNQEKRCEGLKQTEIDNAGLAGYDEWRVFTMEQINILQRLNTDNMTSSLDLSYKLLCPGFISIACWYRCQS